MIRDRLSRSAASSDLDASRPTAGEREGMANRLADALVTRLLETGLAESVIDGVVESLMRGPMLERLVSKVLNDLDKSPAVDALVDGQIARVLPALQRSEALQSLIREQVGLYLAYLEHHPDQIRRLVQQESRGVLREFGDGLRARAFSGDDRLEAWARRLLGRA